MMTLSYDSYQALGAYAAVLIVIGTWMYSVWKGRD